MSKIVVITDSTAYLPPALIQQYGIRIVPLSVIWDGVSYMDGIDIQPAEFYARLAKSKTMPTSSQVTVSVFQALFEELTTQGCDILTITISSKLSGTMDSAIQAKAHFPGANIELFDSLSTTLGMGYQVLAAVRAAEQGASLAECRAAAERVRAKVGILISVNTLEFLHRGGRIGGGARFLGSALNIKPTLELVDGKLEALERVRTRAKALTRLVDLAEERLAGRKPRFLATVHANSPADAQAVLDQISSRLNPAEKMIAELSPVIGTHVGPGTVALIFCAE